MNQELFVIGIGLLFTVPSAGDKELTSLYREEDTWPRIIASSNRLDCDVGLHHSFVTQRKGVRLHLLDEPAYNETSQRNILSQTHMCVVSLITLEKVWAHNPCSHGDVTITCMYVDLCVFT